ncbi:MAG: hypothetical protein RLZZ383_438, partial [Pseudomonadota bacterium]
MVRFRGTAWARFLLLQAALLAVPAAAEAACGDGTRTAGEACDDGNVVVGDGCSDLCELEAEFECYEPYFEVSASGYYLDVSHDPPEWTVQPGRRAVTQAINSYATVFSTTLPADFGVIEFRARVETTNDDDWWGFVVGFTDGEEADPNAEYLLFDWKQAAQSSADLGSAERGTAVSRVSGIPASGDFWAHVGAVDEVAEGVRFGNTGWSDNTWYWVRVVYGADRLMVYVSTDATINTATELEFDVTAAQWEAATGRPLPSGNFGLYNYSQESMRFELITPASDLCGSPDTDLDGTR